MSNIIAPYVQAEDKVVLFDGVCNLCNAWVRFLLRFDTKAQFKLCAVQSEKGQAILAFYGYALDHFDTMLLIEGTQVYTHSTAFIRVVMRLGFPFNIPALSWLIPKVVRNILYTWIAKNRYTLFGQRAECSVPTTAERVRFL